MELCNLMAPAVFSYLGYLTDKIVPLSWYGWLALCE